MRLVDLFRNADRNQDWKLTKEELLAAVEKVFCTGTIYLFCTLLGFELSQGHLPGEGYRSTLAGAAYKVLPSVSANCVPVPLRPIPIEHQSLFFPVPGLGLIMINTFLKH